MIKPAEQGYSLGKAAVVLMVVASLTLSFFTSAVFFINDYLSSQETTKANVRTKADYIGGLVTPALVFNDEISAQRAVDLAESDPALKAVFVYDDQDRIFAQYPAPQNSQEPQESGEFTALHESTAEQMAERYADMLIIESPLINHGQPIGYLKLVHEQAQLQEILTRYISLFATMIVLGLAVAIVLSWFVQYFITNTIRRLSELTVSINQGESYEQRVEVAGFLEIRQLSSTLNSMFDAIQTRDHKLKQQTEELHFKANFDALTQLPNRYQLADKLDSLLTEAQKNDGKLAVLLIDLDRFKYINDSLGHMTGDALLREIAINVTQVLDDKHLFGRLGGDEFVVVIPGLEHQKEAEQLAQQLLDAIKQSVVVEEHRLQVTASIGISIYPDHADDRHHLLSCADIGMYASKALQNNGYRIFKDDLNSFATRLQLEQKLTAAINTNPFEVFYQPQLDIKTQKLRGFEALTRWTDPEFGPIEPSRFIPMAEELGVIHELTYLVVRQVCQDYQRWRRHNLIRVPVAINVSPTSLLLPNFVASLSGILQEHSMSWKDLEIEITEEVFAARTVETVNVFHTLRELGARISLDDFGTRYSALSNLADFPLDRLKIDGSFIRRLEQSDKHKNIVSTIIRLAHGLNLCVIAECVETEQQRQFLETHQCDLMQGFLNYPALSPDDCIDLMSGLPDDYPDQISNAN